MVRFLEVFRGLNRIFLRPNALAVGSSLCRFLPLLAMAVRMAHDWSPSQWISSLSVVLGLGCPVAVFVFLFCVSLVDDLAEKFDSTPAGVLEAVVSHLRTGGCGGYRFGVADTSLGVVVQALSRLCCLLCSGRGASGVFSF